MKDFVTLSKLKRGDKVAILSPSFAAPGRWPHVYELGLKRLRELFELEPVEFSTTKKIGATKEERSKDLIDAFENTEIKAVISTLGGNDQVTYIKNLPEAPFKNNPKPYFGYSDNSHFMNFLWLQGIPSFYGGALFTQFAEQGKIHNFTLQYLKKALFEKGEFAIEESKVFNDIGLNWDEPENLNKERSYEYNEGWIWNGEQNGEGITWGGCLESIDEMLRHGVKIPTLNDFENIILLTETSEEIPTSEYVFRVYRALGERGILSKVKGILVGRPKAWEFNKQFNTEKKKKVKENQRKVILETVRQYNPNVPIIQNIDFGHSDPQVPIPYGSITKIDSKNKKIIITF
jgi:muramoyltetrapeptide carboxypeptidase LdcA involved in peptidoglycan recycling